MDFRGMKRRDLQTLCKKHGIPANLKNTEMAIRLASVFEKETVSETRLSPDGNKENQADCRKAKKVTFRPESENEVFEFTRSVKKPHRKNVKTRTQDLQQGGTMLRRSTRLAAKAGTLVPAKRLCRSKRSADNMMCQAMSDSPRICEEAFVDGVKKLDVNDEMQVCVSFTRSYSKSGSLVKSSKRVTRSMSGLDIETASAQGDLMPEKPQFEKEEAGGANLETRGSSKKPKIMNQECVEDTPQVMIEISPSSSETKPTESVMLTENVLDSESMEVEREEKLEQDTVLMPAIDEHKEEVSSRSTLLIEHLTPASMPLTVSNPEAELVVSTEDIASTIIPEENTKINDETLICTPRSELQEPSSVNELPKVEAIQENSAECCKEIHSSKNDVKGSLENEVQAASFHENFSEYNTEDDSTKEEMKITKVCCMSAGHCVNLTPEKPLDAYAQLELEEEVGAYAKEEADSSKKRKTVSQEFVKEKPQGLAEDSPSTSETKATEPVVISVNVFDSTRKVSGDISPVRNSQELHSEPMEGEREEKYEQDTVLMAVIKKDKGEASSLSEFLIECSEMKTCPDNRSTGCSLSLETSLPPASVQLAMSNPEADLGVPPADIFVKDFVSTVITEKDIKTKEETFIFTPTSELKEHSSVANLAKVEALTSELMEEEREGKQVQDTVESHAADTGTHHNDEAVEPHAVVFTTPEQVSLMGDSGLDEVGKEEEHKATDLPDEYYVLNSTEAYLMLGGSRQNEVRNEGKSIVVELHDESNIATSPLRQSSVGDFKGDGIERNEENRNVELHCESGTCTTPDGHALLGNSASDGAENIGGNKAMEFYEKSVVFTGAKKHFLLEIDEGMKGDNITAKSHDTSDVFTSPERNQLLGNSVLHIAGKQEQKEMESAFFTRLESCLLLGESGQDRLGNSKSGSSQYQSHHASSLKVILKDESVVQESHVAAMDIRENTIADSSKVSYSHELNAGEETAGAEFIPKASQATNVIGQSRGNSPHVDSVKLFDSDIEGAETIMDAERNFYILALPAEGNSETTGKISSDLEVAGTCSMVSEESSPSTNIQNQINDALEELAITDNNEAEELIEAKVTKKTQRGYKGNLLLDSSGGSSVSGKTCVLSGTENEHMGYKSDVDFKNTYEESGHKFLKDEATDPIATAFEKDIPLVPDEFTVHNNRNEEADEEMIERESTPSPEETLNESSENSKEYLNIGESGTLSEKQATREPMLIYRTQVKPKRQDMKENAPNSKIVDNLNVTAPRKSKRQPLQDLSKD